MSKTAVEEKRIAYRMVKTDRYFVTPLEIVKECKKNYKYYDPFERKTKLIEKDAVLLDKEKAIRVAIDMNRFLIKQLREEEKKEIAELRDNYKDAIESLKEEIEGLKKNLNKEK